MTTATSSSRGIRRFAIRMMVVGCCCVAVTLQIWPSLTTTTTTTRTFHGDWHEIIETETEESTNITLTTTTTTTSNLPLLPPQKIWKDYQQWHSQDSLLRDYNNNNYYYHNNRTFVLGLYSCPHQVGNRFHEFFAALQMAIVANATLLWKYYDAEMCDSFFPNRKSNVAKHFCQSHILGNETSCAQAGVTRAPWIPSYDEWAPKLGLPTPQDSQNWTRPMVSPNFVIPYETTYPVPLNAMVKKLKNHHLLSGNFLPSSAMGKRGWDLYSEGVFFLTGMLFEETLPMTRRHATTVRQENNHHNKNDDDVVVSIALHSRHVNKRDLGADITHEKDCLDKVLSKLEETFGNSSKNLKCRVHVMSDREETIQHLKDFIETKRQCQVIIAETKTPAKGLSAEHGNYAGRGFLQDLAMARQARHGLVATDSRSSSWLLQGLIEYDRHFDVHTFPFDTTSHDYRDSTTGRLKEPLATCFLPKGDIRPQSHNNNANKNKNSHYDKRK